MLATADNPPMSKGAGEKTSFAVRAGHRLRSIRMERGWTQRELSLKTDGKLSSSRIANYEQGTREIGILEAEILGKALYVQPAYVMGVTSLRNPLSPAEEELVRNFRALPENERSNYFKRIAALALAYRTPVADEKLGPGWTAPQDEEITQPEEAPPEPKKTSRRKTAKQ
jgi:transcriptional regulator with XRE-family HTH domain